MRSIHKAAMKKRRRNICLFVSYDGTAYHGFQRQNNCLAVQNVLEEALTKVCGDNIELAAAGRTDAGVHAKGQVVNFFTDGKIPFLNLPRAVNRFLPHDIVATSACEVERDFSALHSAKSKLYIYKVYENKIPDPFLRRFVWSYEYDLSLAPMQRALSYLVGKHDFSSFKSAGSVEGINPVRTLYDASCTKEGDIYTFRFFGDGFLYHMVRNIVGTVVKAGNGRLNPDLMPEILAKRDRNFAGKMAPPQGLTLWRVYY